ncbi:MAG: hypothetical protein K6F33_04575 [Bacteroidales bacterium]|nr:hypothetical protein [Bacteroidales bacterium]
MKDFVGVYYFEEGYRQTKSLDYLILKADSTLVHVYMHGNDTIVNTGKWKFRKYRENLSLTSDLDLDFEGKRDKNDIVWNDLPQWYTPTTLCFNIDCWYRFERIDSTKATELRIDVSAADLGSYQEPTVSHGKSILVYWVIIALGSIMYAPFIAVIVLLAYLFWRVI